MLCTDEHLIQISHKLLFTGKSGGNCEMNIYSTLVKVKNEHLSVSILVGHICSHHLWRLITARKMIHPTDHLFSNLEVSLHITWRPQNLTTVLLEENLFLPHSAIPSFITKLRDVITV
jgi:hypothetical protein